MCRSITQNIAKACDVLSHSGSDSGSGARLDAEIILAHLLQQDRSYLFAHGEQWLDANQQAAFTRLIEQRRQGQPVAYLIGSRNFWTLNLLTNPSTLIPRPETEHLVEYALQLGAHADAWQVLDLGTGTGAIALALASEKPGWHITATDVSADALTLAQQNAQRHQIESVQFVQSDWFSEVKGQFDLIVSNPPYIADDDPHLQQGDVRYEPASALVAGVDGLNAIRLIVQQAKSYLKPGGRLLFEHGAEQGMACRAILQQYGYAQINTQCDLAGLDRISSGLTEPLMP